MSYETDEFGNDKHFYSYLYENVDDYEDEEDDDDIDEEGNDVDDDKDEDEEDYSSSHDDGYTDYRDNDPYTKMYNLYHDEDEEDGTIDI